MGFWEKGTGTISVSLIDFQYYFPFAVSHLAFSCVHVHVVLEKKHVYMRPRDPVGRIVHSLCFVGDNASSLRYIPANKLHGRRTFFSF